MRRRALALIGSSVLVLLVLTGGPAGARAKAKRPALRFDQDQETACLEAVPASVAPVASGGPVTLSVQVMLDGVSTARGQQVFSTAARSYAPLGITLRPRFVSVRFTTTSASGILTQAKARDGGRRPAGYDVVFALTSKDLQEGGDTSVAGLADCIGGVRFPNRAFAVGENIDERSIFLHNATAKVAAHEIGHLMGAQHHYANCIEGIPSDLPEPSPCTLMFNDVDLASLNFSTLEGVVVRGHAQDFARP